MGPQFRFHILQRRKLRSWNTGNLLKVARWGSDRLQGWNSELLKSKICALASISHWPPRMNLDALKNLPQTVKNLPQNYGKTCTCMCVCVCKHTGFPGGSVGKESACNAGDTRDVGSIPGLGRSLGKGHGSPLEKPKDRGALRVTVQRVTKSQTWPKRLSTDTHMYTLFRVFVCVCTHVYVHVCFGSL